MPISAPREKKKDFQETIKILEIAQNMSSELSPMDRELTKLIRQAIEHGQKGDRDLVKYYIIQSCGCSFSKTGEKHIHERLLDALDQFLTSDETARRRYKAGSAHGAA